MNKIPKSLRKLNIQDKKRFLDLFQQGSRDDAYFNYLALNKGEVDYLKETIEQIKDEVNNWEKEKTKRQDEARAEAIKMNELARDQGTLAQEKKKTKTGSWHVSKGEEKKFMIDAARFTLDFMAKKWGQDKQVIAKEIDRLEKPA